MPRKDKPTIPDVNPRVIPDITINNYGETMADILRENLMTFAKSHKFIDVSYSVLTKCLYDSKILDIQGIVEKALHSLDQEQILFQVRETMQNQVAMAICNGLLEEMYRDTKRLMTNELFREQLRNRIIPILRTMVNRTEIKE